MDFRAAELRSLRAYARTSLGLSVICENEAIRTLMQDDAAQFMVDWYLKSRTF